MPRNGSGTYSLYTPGNPVVTGTTISSTWANNSLNDIATALTNSIAKDGQTTPTANLPMGAFKFTGLGTGSAATDSLNLAQAQSQAYLALASVTGTDTITASVSPAISAYAAGQTFRFIAANTNTGAATININGVGAKSITKKGTTALVAGDIVANAAYQIYYDGTQFQLANPSTITIPNDSITSALLADSATGLVLINGTITASVGSSNLTIAIKTNAGADPSSTDPVLVIFRNSTLTTGSIVVRSVTAATSVVVSNGSSLGTTASVSALLKVLAIDNAGTVELAVCNGYGNNVVNEGGVISTTAEGGAGAADSADAIYSTTARSNVACRVIGSINITPGASFAWSASPTSISNGVQNTQLAMPGMLCAPKAVTSGSSSTVTVPSWAKRVTATFTAISTNGTSSIYVRLGDSGGIENTGYNGTVSTFNSASNTTTNISSAFNITSGAVAASNYSGKLELNLHNPYTNTWIAEGGLSRNDNTTCYLVRGDKSLTTQLTTIELGTSDTFDGSGEWNVLFE